MTTPTITVPIATSKTTSCQLNLPWFVQCTEYVPAPATFEPLVNGERAFSSVYDAISAAKTSVEIICWGFSRRCTSSAAIPVRCASAIC